MASISALMIQDGTPSVQNPRQENERDLQKSTTQQEPSQSSDSASGSGQLATNMDVDDDSSMVMSSQGVNAPVPTVAADEKRLADSDEGQEHDDEDGEDKTDDEGDQTEGGSASRKKKGQRFFCTGYPPCNLSFTRSEHLARHIRKHTGERPFQCHCNRRFSRLDNLRQHAQTVHINDEIPGDSLAATGTRYQRQIRTDRVRPAPRPRTGTMSSGSGHARGHSRNLSTSSIGSTSSVYSNTADVRRRPPPLMMASDNRPSTPPTYSHYAAQSPGDLSTPTSSTYPATPSSPNFSTIGSPNSTASRPYGETRTPARRLSVPATYNSFYPYPNQSSSSYGPGPAVSTSVSSSIVTSPTSATFPHQPGSTFGAYSGPDDWRRRTWHPSTYSNINSYNRPATSSLTYSQTPDAPAPAYAHGAMSAAGQAPRLPGIESFDHVQHRPTTPPRRNLTPPQTAAGQRLLAAPEIDGPRRGHTPHASWDGSKRSLYPDIDDNGRPTSDWSRQPVSHGNPFRPTQPQQNPVQPSMGPPPNIGHQQSQQMAQQALHLESSASKRVKRSGQYTGPGTNQRTSPDSSSSDGIPTPGTSAAEINPAIMNSNGYIEPQLLAGENQHTPCMAPLGSVLSPHESQYGPSRTMHPPRPRRASELDRLEALVAVATRETKR